MILLQRVLPANFRCVKITFISTAVHHDQPALPAGRRLVIRNPRALASGGNFLQLVLGLDTVHTARGSCRSKQQRPR